MDHVITRWPWYIGVGLMVLLLAGCSSQASTSATPISDSGKPAVGPTSSVTLTSDSGSSTVGPTFFATPSPAFIDALNWGGYPLITLEQVGNIPSDTHVRVVGTWFDGNNTMYQIIAMDGSTAEARQDQLALASGAIPSPAPTIHLDATPTAIPMPTPTPIPPAAHLRTLYGKFIAMAFSKDGKTLATVEDPENGGLVRLWDTATGEVRYTLEGAINLDLEFGWQWRSTEHLRWSPDGSKLAVVSGPTVTLWDGATGQHLQTLTPAFPENADQAKALLGVAWSGDRLLIVGDAGYDLIVWDAETGQILHTLKRPPLPPSQTPETSLLFFESTINGFAWSPYGATLVSGDIIGKFQLWNPVSGALMRTFKLPFGRPLGGAVAFSPDGSRLISAAGTHVLDRYEYGIGPVIAWDILTGEEVYTLSGLSGMVSGVSFSPDGTMLATGASRGLWRPEYCITDCDAYGDITLWDAKTGAYLNAMTGLSSAIADVAWSPTGDIIAARMSNDTITLWSVQAILSSAPPPRPTPIPTATPALRPDGKVAVEVYFDALNPVPVKRIVEPAASLPEAVLTEFFDDQDGGDYTGFSQFRIENGIAYVNLIGQCGAYSRTVGLITMNLGQFPEIRHVRVFVSYGDSVIDVYDTLCMWIA